jgi:HD-GYP domain-containing protein (c-di-GMP phosphodiesterase class II)
MSQTILIEPETELKSIFKLNLYTYTGTDVVERNNSVDTLELLKILPTISLIICKSHVDGERTAETIYAFLQNHNMDIPMIVLGECPAISGEVLSLKEPTSWELVVKYAGRLLGITANETTKQIQPNYVPIGIHYFFDIDHTPCDVYIRVKNSASEFQFVKRLHEQDRFTADDIQKYIAQGLKNFYIPRDYQQYFVTFVTNSIIDRLENDLPLLDRLSTNSNSFEMVKEHIQKIGFTPEVSELAEANINSMVKAIKKAPKLADLLKFLLNNKISYAYQKAHLVCVLGNFILAKQSWYEERHLEIFTYLSFFADITLKSTMQMRMNSNIDLDNSDLSEKEKLEVLEHAKNASELIRQYGKTSDYLELIILQHQGMENGIGFPDEPADDIHPIARVFIISDAFVKLMLDPTTAKNKKDILTVLYMQFSTNQYQKIVKVLEQKIE